jgi:hypothetical protein
MDEAGYNRCVSERDSDYSVEEISILITIAICPPQSFTGKLRGCDNQSWSLCQLARIDKLSNDMFSPLEHLTLEKLPYNGGVYLIGRPADAIVDFVDPSWACIRRMCGQFG